MSDNLQCSNAYSVKSLLAHLRGRFVSFLQRHQLLQGPPNFRYYESRRLPLWVERHGVNNSTTTLSIRLADTYQGSWKRFECSIGFGELARVIGIAMLMLRWAPLPGRFCRRLQSRPAHGPRPAWSSQLQAFYQDPTNSWPFVPQSINKEPRS